MSLIIRLADAFTDATLPLLYRDPILNAGSQFLFDFSNPYCWDPAKAVVDAATIKNLQMQVLSNSFERIAS